MSVGVPVTIPDFSIEITPPTSCANTSSPYALTNLSDGFTLTAKPAAPATSFPRGTTFLWTSGSDRLVEEGEATYTPLNPSQFDMTAASPGTAADDASKSVYVLYNSSSMIPDAANATYN